MLALDVNLKQSWRGEDLLTLLTFMELHICKAHREEQKDGSLWLDSDRAGAGVMPNTEQAPTKCQEPSTYDISCTLVVKTPGLGPDGLDAGGCED